LPLFTESLLNIHTHILGKEKKCQDIEKDGGERKNMVNELEIKGNESK